MLGYLSSISTETEDEVGPKINLSVTVWVKLANS